MVLKFCTVESVILYLARLDIEEEALKMIVLGCFKASVAFKASYSFKTLAHCAASLDLIIHLTWHCNASTTDVCIYPLCQYALHNETF